MKHALVAVATFLLSMKHTLVIAVALLLGAFLIAQGIVEASLNQRYAAYGVEGRHYLVDQKTGATYWAVKRPASAPNEYRLEWLPILRLE